MILLLVFGSRPQWLMNFARSLLNLTRGKTLILSPTRRGAKCKSILRYRRPSMESLYLQNNQMNEKGDKNKRNKMGKNFTFVYYSMLSDDRNTYFGPYFLVWSRVQLRDLTEKLILFGFVSFRIITRYVPLVKCIKIAAINCLRMMKLLLSSHYTIIIMALSFYIFFFFF